MLKSKHGYYPHVQLTRVLRTVQGCESLSPGFSESECSLKPKLCTYCPDLAAYRHNKEGKDKLKRATQMARSMPGVKMSKPWFGCVEF